MDARTRRKHIASVRTMLHVMEGHLNKITPQNSISRVFEQGMRSAQALSYDMLAREERIRGMHAKGVDGE